MKKLTIKELVTATNGTLIFGNENNHVSDVVIDSRNANEENVFIAIVGENLDGHNFISSAYENGCKTFIKNKSNSIKLNSSDINLIEVDDTEGAIGDISKYYKSKFDIPYVGVTGSVGKTTTRDMIYAAVSNDLNTLKNQGNLNNQLGVPLTLFKLEDSHECAIIEMGMSGFNEIEYLADIVNPKVGVISNIGMSHIENLGSQEGILKAKMEITANFDESCTLVINGDDKYLQTVKDSNEKYKIQTFGFNDSNDVYCKNYNSTKESITFTCVVEGVEEEVFVPTAGEHNIYNAMAAIIVGRTLGLTMSQIKEGLKNFKATAMRLDMIKTDSLTIINDAYNASPDSMNAALKILGQYDERKVAILGDMFEMGEHSEEGHRLVGKAVTEKADILITIGKDSSFIGDEAIKLGYNKDVCYHFETKEDAINELDKIIKEQDVILVKASRGMKLEKIVEHLNK